MNNYGSSRSLMERATIYRSISAFTALIGGLLSILGCIVILVAGFTNSIQFLWVWLVVLFLTGLTSLGSLWSGSKARKEPFFSPGLRMASTSIAPSALLAVTISVYVWLLAYPFDVVPIWIAIYGVALLSTQHFAPTSIKFLGWSFVAAGTILLLLNAFNLFGSSQTAAQPSIVMAATFGLFHLIYAGAVWLSGEEGTAGRREGADV